MVTICLIFLTSCKTIEYVYVYPDIQPPAVEPIPTKTYREGGFSPTETGQQISTIDARILAQYIQSLKDWGDSGWSWVQYYISEIDKLKAEQD